MIEFRSARTGDGDALAAMATQCFCDTFGPLYRQADLDAFLSQAFGPAGLPAQIDDPSYAIRLALEDGAIAGFAKLGPCALPQPAPRDAAELKQLYVLKAWQGSSVSTGLMDWVIETARTQGADCVVLSVFVDNHRAKRFYARYGFVEIGKAPFPVGEQIDDDRIWCKALHDR